MTSVSKSVYIDKLADTVGEYNNTYQSTIKIKPTNVKSSDKRTLISKMVIKILNLKLVIK